MSKNKQAAARRKRRLLLVIVIFVALVAVAVALAIGGVNMLRREWAASSSPHSESSPPSESAAASAQTETTTIASQKTTTEKTTAGTHSGTAGRYVQKDRSQWNLLLVNDYNSVPDNYLATFTMANFNGASKQCDSRIVEPLRNMINAGNAANASFRLSAASLYRTEELQAKNYNNKVNYYKGKGYDQKTAESKAATVIKRPGQSEHNTGLCVDLLGAGYSSLEQSFANTEAYKWLKANCAKYGFILRYPKEKEAITAVIFEPWHYRYVGVEAATEIMNRGLSLEEYIEEKER